MKSTIFIFLIYISYIHYLGLINKILDLDNLLNIILNHFIITSHSKHTINKIYISRYHNLNNLYFKRFVPIIYYKFILFSVYLLNSNEILNHIMKNSFFEL